MESHDKSCFVTLTYEDSALPVFNSVYPYHLQLFFKRLRRKVDEKIKFYACGEYGDKYDRAHYHCIIYGVGTIDHEYAKIREKRICIGGPILEAWNEPKAQGFVEVTDMTPKRARYTAKYIQKKLFGDYAEQEYRFRWAPFSIMSKGLGERYCFEHEGQIRENMEVTIAGKKKAIPRFYKKKLELDMSEVQSEAKMELYERLRGKGVEPLDMKDEYNRLTVYDHPAVKESLAQQESNLKRMEEVYDDSKERSNRSL